MSSLIQKRLSAFKQQPRLQAGSLIVSVFGDAIYPKGGSIWLGCLIRLLGPLGLNDRLIRTAIYRLVKEDWLQAKSFGRRTDYGLSPTGRARIESASKLIYADGNNTWDKHWRMLISNGQAPSNERERLRHFLFWHGFGQWNPHTFIHPSADLNDILDRLDDEGMSAWRSQLLCVLSPNISQDDRLTQAQVVKQSWDLAHLSHSYQHFVRLYQPIWMRLQQSNPAFMSDQDAFHLRILLVHDFRRLLLRDPSLPDALLPTNWPGLDARRVFNGLYLNCLPASQQFLDEHLQLADDSHPSTPMNHTRSDSLTSTVSRMLRQVA